MKAKYEVTGPDLRDLIEQAQKIAANFTETAGPDLIQRYKLDLDITAAVYRWQEEGPSFWSAEVTLEIQWAE